MTAAPCLARLSFQRVRRYRGTVASSTRSAVRLVAVVSCTAVASASSTPPVGTTRLDAKGGGNRGRGQSWKVGTSAGL